MCLIIFNPAGNPLPSEHLDNGWSHNSDGAGYMFADRRAKKLVIRKGFFKLKNLKTALAADHAEHGTASPFVIHFRFATHGKKNEENCHPHAVCDGQVGLAHNGVLSDFEPPFRAEYSDTVHFCRTVMAYRCAEHIVDETFRTILADMIGTGNKFVLLRETGEYSIVNETAGTWHAGNWYSNATYKTAAVERWNWKQASTAAATSALPARYRVCGASLFDKGGHVDPWDEETREYLEDEREELTAALDDIDLKTDWGSLTYEEQEQYLAIYRRVGELDRQLDSRLH
jgi:predicted glutamine amidotransferase